MMDVGNLFKHWAYGLFAPGTLLRERYEAFRRLLELDKRCHELIAELQQYQDDGITVDFSAVQAKCEALSSGVSLMVRCLGTLCPTRYLGLSDYFKKIDFYIKLALSPPAYSFSPPFVLGLGSIAPDMLALVGGKAFHLARVKNALHLPVPEGFVVTANAFNYFLEANDLRASIDHELAGLDIRDTEALETASRLLREIIEAAPVPEPIAAEILEAVHGLCGEDADEAPFSVRSSAVGEDGKNSYAGQYESLLNVPAGGVLSAYKRVLSSKYAAGALFYRISCGQLDIETPMSVLISRMLAPKASGVIYTRDPTDAARDRLIIHTVRGLCQGLVDGSVDPVVTTVTRTPPYRLDREEQPHPEILTGETAAALAQWAVRIEEAMGGSQDIEWCQDQAGRLFVLQSRPLRVEPESGAERPGRQTIPGHRVLLRGGSRASGGMAAGAVYNAEAGGTLDRLPDGAVLVARHPRPDYALVMGKLRALVTDFGSHAGHLVTIAREFGIPALVGTGSASTELATGQAVTVDADGMAVYEGTLPGAETAARPPGTRQAGETPVGKMLQQALMHISPLHLLDPKSEGFAPEACRTFHDIIRFCHEKAIQEIFSLGDRKARGARGAKKLKSDIPIVVYLLDVGGGLDEKLARGKEVALEAVCCEPFQQIWQGLSHPHICWHPDVVHFDWQEFDRLNQGLIRPDSIQFASYAVLSRDYLNLHIHFGYHFVVIDTLAGDDPAHNYLALRFAGGGGQPDSRLMRVQFLAEVLSRLGFAVEKKGDLVDAQVDRCERERLRELLQTLGILLGCTRLLDLALTDMAAVDDMVERFFRGDYALSPIH